jgi:hypothetical protein
MVVLILLMNYVGGGDDGLVGELSLYISVTLYVNHSVVRWKRGGLHADEDILNGG